MIFKNATTAIIRRLGEDVQFRNRHGDIETKRGVFSREYSQQFDATTTIPTLFCDSEFMQAGEWFKIRGQWFQIVRVENDEHGEVIAHLKLWKSEF